MRKRFRKFRFSFSRFAIGICVVTELFLLASCSRSSASSNNPNSNPGSTFVAQPYGGKLEPDDGQWIRPAKDLASTRYSTLDQINHENVKQLKLAWTFSTGTLRGLEAAPLVVNNTLYLVTPWPNTLYAL